MIEETQKADSTPMDVEHQQQNSLAKFFVDLKYLFLEQIFLLRTIWSLTLIFSLFMPLSLIFGLSKFGSGLADTNSLVYIITGSAIFSIGIEGIYTMSQRVSVMKAQQKFIFYASLPISKTALILALLSSRILVVGLPGILAPVFIGSLAYGLPLQPTLIWIVVLMPLTGFCLATLGMTIGVVVENQELVGLIANLLTFIMLLAAPIYIPATSLPLPLQIVSLFFPPTYAADALRHCVTGNLNQDFYSDIAVLVIMTGICFFLINKFMKWRAN